MDYFNLNSSYFVLKHRPTWGHDDCPRDTARWSGQGGPCWQEGRPAAPDEKRRGTQKVKGAGSQSRDLFNHTPPSADNVESCGFSAALPTLILDVSLAPKDRSSQRVAGCSTAVPCTE